MAIVVTHLASGSPGPVSSVTTASVVIAPNALVLVSIYNKLDPSGGNTPTLSGAGVTWTQHTNPHDGKTQQTVYRTLSTTGGSGALSIGFGGQSQQAVYYSVDQFQNVIQSGVNGAGAIIQLTTLTSGLSPTTTINLSAFANSQNVAFGSYGDDASTPVTAGSGFTNLYNNSNSYCSEYAVNKPSVVWTGNGSLGVALAMEIGIDITGGFPGSML